MTPLKWCILEPNISQYSNMFNQANTNVIFNDYFLIRLRMEGRSPPVKPCWNF